MNLDKQTTRSNIIKAHTLVELFGYFKEYPNKTFRKGEFPFPLTTCAKYLNLLMRMGLIECKPTFYRTGRKKKVRRKYVRGYKLIWRNANV